MATNTQTISGVVTTPGGSPVVSGYVQFKLSSPDGDVSGNENLPRMEESVAIGSDGSFSVELWPNTRGYKGTVYSVYIQRKTPTGPVHEKQGNIQVGESGPYDLAGLLSAHTPPANNIYYRVISQAEYDAAIAAVADAQAWAESPTAPGDPGTKSSKTWAGEAAASAATAGVGNVMAFGAVADGETDTIPAFNATIAGTAELHTFATGPRKVIRFPAGSYMFSSTGLIPSYVEVLLSDGAYIKLADDADGNLFRNANALAYLTTERTSEVLADTSVTGGDAVGSFHTINGYRYEVIETPSSLVDETTWISPYVNGNGVWLRPDIDRHVYLRGEGGGTSTLDGNGKLKKQRPPNGWRDVGVLLVGVENYEISHLRIRDTAMYAMSQESGCRHGNVHNIVLGQIGFGDGSGITNQDGINIRVGSDISISEIYGTSGDDSIALTCLHPVNDPTHTYPTTNVSYRWSWGRETGIKRIDISNINARPIGKHNVVRITNSDDRIIEGITIDGVFDTTPVDMLNNESLGLNQVHACVRLGDYGNWGKTPAPAGSIRDITITNVKSLAREILLFRGHAKDVKLSNVTAGCIEHESKTLSQNVVTFDQPSSGEHPGAGYVVENLVVDGVTFQTKIPVVGGVDNLLDAGRIVWAHTNCQIINPVFRNMDIARCRHVLHQESDAKMVGAVFDGLTVRSTGQHVFRVDSSANYAGSSGEINDLFIPDRTQINLEATVTTGRVWNSRNYFALSGKLPDVTSDDIVPNAIAGSEVYFAAGVLSGATNGPFGDGTTNPFRTKARADGVSWTSTGEVVKRSGDKDEGYIVYGDGRCQAWKQQSLDLTSDNRYTYIAHVKLQNATITVGSMGAPSGVTPEILGTLVGSLFDNAGTDQWRVYWTGNEPTTRTVMIRAEGFYNGTP